MKWPLKYLDRILDQIFKYAGGEWPLEKPLGLEWDVVRGFELVSFDTLRWRVTKEDFRNGFLNDQIDPAALYQYYYRLHCFHSSNSKSRGYCSTLHSKEARSAVKEVLQDPYSEDKLSENEYIVDYFPDGTFLEV